MHAPYDKSRKSTRSEPKSSVGFLILPAAIALVLIVLTTLHPKASLWISQAAEAEFVGGLNPVVPPTETAEPGMDAPLQTVDAVGGPIRKSLSIQR